MTRSRIAPGTRRRARALRREPTEAEKALWRALDPWRRSGLHIRRQAPVGPWIADFAVPSLKLIIEVDGGQHAGAAGDRQRDAWLAAQGFRVLRLWNGDALANMEGCLAVIDEAIVGRRREIEAGGT